jgi:hypothetical protein
VGFLQTDDVGVLASEGEDSLPFAVVDEAATV